MNKQERLKQILERVTEDGSGEILSTRTLAEEFAVSEITMRRDLQELAGTGLIQRRHGGVSKPRSNAGILRNVGIVLVSYRGKFSNPFFNELLEGADGELERLGYHPAFVKTFVDVSSAGQVHELAELHSIEGLLIFGGLSRQKVGFWKAVTDNIVSAPIQVEPGIDAVLIDGYQGMRAMVKHLVQIGHRRIGFIIGHELPARIGERMRGYLAGLAECDLAPHEALIYEDSHTLERLPAKIGQRGAEKMMGLSEPPDAIICSSDLIALNAMQWIQAHGYTVPNDVAVTGFDDIPETAIAYPPLTTVHVHKHLLGRLAAEQLHRRIERSHDPPLRVITPTSLVIRQSCGAAS